MGFKQKFSKFWGWVGHFDTFGSLSAQLVAGWSFILAGVTFLWSYLTGLKGPELFVITLGIFAFTFFLLDQYNKWGEKHKNKDRQVTKRISLIDFYKEAEKKGWDFSSDGSLHILDIAEGIRQAGLDGVIRTWGKKVNMFDSITKSEPLLELPKTYWKNYKLNAVAALKTIYNDNSGLNDENFPICTHNIAGGIGERYQDIHLYTEQSLEWLNTEAEQYKGRNKR